MGSQQVQRPIDQLPPPGVSLHIYYWFHMLMSLIKIHGDNAQAPHGDNLHLIHINRRHLVATRGLLRLLHVPKLWKGIVNL